MTAYGSYGNNFQGTIFLGLIFWEVIFLGQFSKGRGKIFRVAKFHRGNFHSWVFLKGAIFISGNFLGGGQFFREQFSGE